MIHHSQLKRDEGTFQSEDTYDLPRLDIFDKRDKLPRFMPNPLKVIVSCPLKFALRCGLVVALLRPS